MRYGPNETDSHVADIRSLPVGQWVRKRGGGDLVVRGRLYDFAEADGEGISGLVTMEFELYDRKTAKVLWSHFYSHTEPVEARQVPSVVQALDRNLERGLKEVIAGLGQYFAANAAALANPASESLHEAKAK